MDIFERYLKSESDGWEEDRNEVIDRGHFKSQTGNGLPKFKALGGRKGFQPGDKFNHIEVIGPKVQQGKHGVPYSNREYVVRCIAPGREGKACGNQGIATYHQIYYQSVYSCGCTMRPKHPPIKLEGQRIGRVEVLRWTEEHGGMWELVCHECGEILYRKTVYQVRAAGNSCDSHGNPIA